jgi:hypothetical protein
LTSGVSARSSCSSCTLPIEAITSPKAIVCSGRSCSADGSRASHPPTIGIDDSGRLSMAGTRVNAAA